MGETPQLSAQEPGPRGSPHVVQGPAAACRIGVDEAPTAKTDSSRTSDVLSHRGQDGLAEPRTSVSKR